MLFDVSTGGARDERRLALVDSGSVSVASCREHTPATGALQPLKMITAKLSRTV